MMKSAMDKNNVCRGRRGVLWESRGGFAVAISNTNTFTLKETTVFIWKGYMIQFKSMILAWSASEGPV